jgi:adenine/guanine/hypoxanthine permease
MSPRTAALKPTPRSRATLERFFELNAHGSSVSQEIRAGVTTFFTMSYVLFVNPQVLGSAIRVPGVTNMALQLLMATAIASALGCLMMGLVARYPFAQAPAMGLNAYFALTVVQGGGVPWPAALGAVFLAGLLFVLISLAGVRQRIVDAIPGSLKVAVTAGVGALIAFLGFQHAGLVVAAPGSLLRMGSPHTPALWVALLGLVLAVILMQRRVPGALLLSMLISTAVAILGRLPVYPGGLGGAAQPFPGFGGSLGAVVAAPIWPADLVGHLDLAGALSPQLLGVALTLLLVTFFDVTGTVSSLAGRAKLFDEHGQLPRARRTYAVTGLSAMLGAFTGTSTTMIYMESASGISEGGRTGLSAVTVGLLFALSLFVWPLAAAIPAAATAPALILVGALMMQDVARVPWDDLTEALPAFLTILGTPLTFSIANGLSLGVISYCLIKACAGQARRVSPVLYGVGALMVARYVWLGAG